MRDLHPPLELSKFTNKQSGGCGGSSTVSDVCTRCVMMASMKGYPVLPSFHAANSSASEPDAVCRNVYEGHVDVIYESQHT